MTSNLPGIATSDSEVTSIGLRGFWLLVGDREYFVPFADYPAFLKASVDQIFTCKILSSSQLYWPALDVDIELDALEHPEQYPLIWRS
jgi:hypothetical protein